jgi:hypothetical protein
MNINSWLMISVIFFVLTTVIAVVYAFWRKKARPSDPIIIFLFFFSLFVLPLPFRAYFTRVDVGDVTEHLTAIYPYMPMAVFLSAVGLPFFTIAYYSSFTLRIAARLPRPRTGTRARISFLVLGGISLCLFMMLARGSGGILGFILLGYRNYEVTAGKGYLWVGLVWLPIASEFLLYNYAIKRKKLDLLLFLGMLAVLITMFLILGGRAPIVYFGLTIWIFWHHAIRPISVAKLAAIGVPIFLSLNLVGALRESNYTSFGEVWQKATDSGSSQLDESGTLFYTLTTGEFVVPFETLPQMIKSVGNEISPQFGLTYLEAPLFVIPTDIFPDRPAALQNWYMQKFYGDYFTANEGRSFFFLAEGYLNFGPLGVFATMTVWGVLLGTAHGYIRKARGEPGAALLYALTVAFIFRGIAGHSSSWIAGLTSQSLGIAIIGLWIANGRIFGSFSVPVDSSKHTQYRKFTAAAS